jgi:hypothetical protein
MNCSPNRIDPTWRRSRAPSEYRRWLDQEYVAVRSDDGATYEPLTGDRLPVDAAEVILTTAMGGG